MNDNTASELGLAFAQGIMALRHVVFITFQGSTLSDLVVYRISEIEKRGDIRRIFYIIVVAVASTIYVC